MSKPLMNDSIVLNSLSLAGGINNNFTDIELANRLGVKREELLEFFEENTVPELRRTKKDWLDCECGGKVEIFDGIDTLYCNACSKKYSSFPKYSFGINSNLAIEFLKQKVLSLQNNIVMLQEDDSKLILGFDKYKLATYLSIEKTDLNDLYVLKGWSINYQPDFFMIVSADWNFSLQSEQSKGLIALLRIDELADPKIIKRQLRAVKLGFERSTNEKALESKLRWVPKDNLDWINIENYWKDLLTNITIYAVQKGSEPPKVQGEKFQKYVIDLLRSTIFEAKYIGGKNSPDGTIFIHAQVDLDKSELIPLEVKTDNSGFVKIQEYEAQVRKYIRAFRKPNVTDKYVIKRLIVLGNDFKFESKKEKKVINKLESDLNIKIVLFPINSLARLVSLYYQYQISRIDSDLLIDFLNNGYITPASVDELMNRLKMDSEQKDKDMYDKIKSSLEQVGY